MNKTQAAEILGISVRSLERHTSANRIAARYEKGATRSVLDYEESEVERFKAELESAVHSPTLEALPRPQSAKGTNPANSDTALARFDEVGVNAGNPAAFALLSALLEQGRALGGKAGTPETAPAQKLLLSLAEAQSYSGLSRANLMEAIGAQTLPAQKIGRGWKIKRRDLESYIDGL